MLTYVSVLKVSSIHREKESTSHHFYVEYIQTMDNFFF